MPTISGTLTGGSGVGVIPGGGNTSTNTGTSTSVGTGTNTNTSTSGVNLGAINPSLTSSIDQFLQSLNIQNQQAANAAQVPNDPALEQQSSTNIASALSGQLPPDVQALLSQQAAERGISTGSPGSQDSSAALLQSLGLNSLNLENQGQSWLSAADQRNPAAPVVNALSLVPSTTNSSGTNTSNNTSTNAGSSTQPNSSGGGSGGGTGAGTGSYDPFGFGNLAGGSLSATNPLSQSGLSAPGSGTSVIPFYSDNNSSIYNVPDQTQVNDLNSGLGPVSPGYNPSGSVAPGMNPVTGTPLDTSGGDIFGALNLGGSLSGINPSLYDGTTPSPGLPPTDVTQPYATAPAYDTTFDPTGGFNAGALMNSDNTYGGVYGGGYGAGYGGG